MTLEETVVGLFSYGSGVALGILIGLVFGFYLALFFFDKWNRFRGVSDPGEIVRKSLKRYRKMNDSLYEAEKFLDYPESAQEEEDR